jgi:uncharacterized protein with HEPN domain
MKDNKLKSFERLIHIRHAIQDIAVFIDGVDEDTFIKDPLISSAVLFQFGVIGEAVNHLDEELLRKYNYPWYKVKAFRNLISQDYFQIKLEAVWEVIVSDLPDLKQLIDMILEQEY